MTTSPRENAVGNIVERTSECLNGMQRFERSLKARVEELMGDPQLAFRWSGGRSFIPLPDALSLEVIARDGRHASAVLSRVQLEDSAACVDRPDVILLVDQLAHDVA